jgi:hypothetical protein
MAGKVSSAFLPLLLPSYSLTLTAPSLPSPPFLFFLFFFLPLPSCYIPTQALLGPE